MEEFVDNASDNEPIIKRNPEEEQREKEMKLVKRILFWYCFGVNTFMEHFLPFWEKVRIPCIFMNSILKLAQLVSSTHTWCIASYYGVFAVMTLYRHEIIIEGWDEASAQWKEYQLYYKPGTCFFFFTRASFLFFSFAFHSYRTKIRVVVRP